MATLEQAVAWIKGFDEAGRDALKTVRSLDDAIRRLGDAFKKLDDLSDSTRKVADNTAKTAKAVNQLAREFNGFRAGLGRSLGAAEGLSDAFDALSGKGRITAATISNLGNLVPALGSSFGIAGVAVGALTVGFQKLVEAEAQLSAKRIANEIDQLAAAAKRAASGVSAYFEAIADGASRAEAAFARMSAELRTGFAQEQNDLSKRIEALRKESAARDESNRKLQEQIALRASGGSQQGSLLEIIKYGSNAFRSTESLNQALARGVDVAEANRQSMQALSGALEESADRYGNLAKAAQALKPRKATVEAGEGFGFDDLQFRDNQGRLVVLATLEVDDDVLSALRGDTFADSFTQAYGEFLYELQSTWRELGSRGAGNAIRGALSVAGGALNQGRLGGIFSGIQQGASVGGAYGAVAGGVTALITQSKQFERLMGVLNEGLAPFADFLGEALAPLIPVVKEIGDAFRPLLFILRPLVRLFTVLNPSFLALQLSVKALTFASKLLFDAFKFVGEAFLKLAIKLANAIGAGTRRLRDALDDLQNSSWDTAGDVDDLGDAAAETAAELVNVPEGFKYALRRFQAIAASNAGAVGGGGSVIGGGGGTTSGGNQTPYNAPSSNAATASGGGGGITIVIQGVHDMPSLFRAIEREFIRKNIRLGGSLVPVG